MAMPGFLECCTLGFLLLSRRTAFGLSTVAIVFPHGTKRPVLVLQYCPSYCNKYDPIAEGICPPFCRSGRPFICGNKFRVLRPLVGLVYSGVNALSATQHSSPQPFDVQDEKTFAYMADGTFDAHSTTPPRC
jgi:hypothetical protein